MQLSSETRRAIEYLRGIFESGRILKLGEPHELNGGRSYLFAVTAFDKEWALFLTREDLDDTPGTKEYRESASELARALDARFKNVDPNLFATTGGRLLRILPDWPPLTLMPPDHGSRAGTGLRVRITDVNSGAIARCIIQMTTSQTTPGINPGPFKSYEAIINSIRAAADRSEIHFYSPPDAHPNTLQPVDLDYGAKNPHAKTPTLYIQEKVWTCGFKIGGQGQSVWIADPWDATYLACPLSTLQQASAILNAQEKINLSRVPHSSRQA